jgi:uncharacterized protein YndB with AHSA1/START domain
MTNHGERLGPGTVRFVRDLPGPIQRVWDHLVDADLKAKWFCGGAIEARVGGRVEMHFDHAKLSPESDAPPPVKYADMPAQSSFSGEVTACEPPRRLAYTWTGDGEHSLVTFELNERGDRVRLTLTHEDLRSRDEVVGVCGGWHTHLDILHDVLTGIVPAPFWKRYGPIDAEYESRID